MKTIIHDPMEQSIGVLVLGSAITFWYVIILPNLPPELCHHLTKSTTRATHQSNMVPARRVIGYNGSICVHCFVACHKEIRR